MKLFEICSVVFFFKEKGFLHKFLCSFVIVLLLYLLKFISTCIKFFPTIDARFYLFIYFRTRLMSTHRGIWDLNKFQNLI